MVGHTIVAWEPATDRTVWRFELARASTFAVSPEGHTVVCTDATGWCAVLDGVQGELVMTFRELDGAPEAVCVAAGRVLMVRAGHARLRALADGSVLYERVAYGAAALSRNGTRVASLDRARATVTVCELDDGRTTMLRAPRGRTVTAMAFNDQGVLALGHDDGSVRSWDRCEVVARRAATGTAVTALGWHDGGLIVGHCDGTLQRCDAEDSWCTRYAGTVGAIAPARGVALHRDAAGVSLTCMATRMRTDARVGHTDAISALALSSDGSHAVSASFDGTLRLWNIAHDQCVALFEGHDDACTGAVLSADGRTLWSVGARDGLRIWDLATGFERAHHPHVPISMMALTVSPDGTRLLGQSPLVRGGATVWLLDAEEARVLARGRVAVMRTGAVGFDRAGARAFMAVTPRNDGALVLSAVDGVSGQRDADVVVPGPVRVEGRARPCVDHCFAVEGTLAAAASTSGALLRVSLDEGAPEHYEGGGLLRCRHVVVGATVVAGADSDRVEVVALRGGRRASLRLPCAGDRVTALALDPQERWLLAGTRLGTVLRVALTSGE
jgi:hypothetical protein